MKAHFQKFSPEELPSQLTCHAVDGGGRPVITSPHWHTEVECYLVLSGQCTVQVANTQYTAQEGDLFIVNCDQVHALYSIGDEPCSYLLLIFDYESVVRRRNDVGIFSQDVIFRNPITAQCPQYQALCDAMCALERERDAKDYGHVLIKHGLVQQFCGLLTRSECYDIGPETSHSLEREREMLACTFNLIRDWYFKPIQLKDAAAAANLSVPHFCRLFRKTTGMTFNDYLNHYRTRRANTLLREGATLEQTAQECGFGSTASLIRSFHKFYQSSPRAYVKEH